MSFNTQCIKHSKIGSLPLNDIIYDLIIPLIPLRETSEIHNSQNNQTTQNSTSNTSNIENKNSDHKVYESITQSKKNPRVRITNCKTDTNGIATQITLNAYQNHTKIFEIKIGLDNEKVTLNALLLKLEKETSALNIKIIEWPIHDLIFKICTISEFKKAANSLLNNLQIKLIQTPVIETDKQMQLQMQTNNSIQNSLSLKIIF